MNTIASFALIGFTCFAFGLSTEAVCQTQVDHQIYASVGIVAPRIETSIEPARKLFIPKLSLVHNQDGESVHILNPDHNPLTIEVKDGNDQAVTGWDSENFEITDPKQTISFGGLKAGIYWVEISSPEKQSIWFKWEKK